MQPLQLKAVPEQKWTYLSEALAVDYRMSIVSQLCLNAEIATMWKLTFIKY